MPRGKLLASEGKEFADAYRDTECSNRTIAKKLMDHVVLVNNCVNLAKDYGKSHARGGSWKLTKKQHSLLMRTATRN